MNSDSNYFIFHPRLCHGFCLWLVALGLTIASPWAQSQQSDIVQEYRLKAAFLYNFSQFIEWPESAFATPETPFTICVVGDDPFGDTLLALQKRKYQARAIEIIHPQSIAEARNCRILYVDDPRKSALWRDIVKNLGDTPVLTVTSSDDAMTSGVCIGFVPRDGKVRWTMNLNAARKAQLKISAKLIEIAVAIVGEAPR
jgi:hypothetical protein